MTIEKIYDFINKKGISVNEFSKSIGVSNGYFSKQRAAGGAVTSNIIEKIVNTYPEIDLNELFGKKPSIQIYDTNKFVPVYPHIACAGKVQLFKDLNQSQSDGYISVPRMPRCDGAIPVVGDSMYPLLKSGDLVCYQIKEVQDIIYGEMYIIDWTDSRGDDYLAVKYVAKGSSKDHIKLISHNKHHDDIEINKKCIRQLALVKLTVRYNSL